MLLFAGACSPDSRDKPEGEPLFVKVPGDESGITFTNTVKETYEKFFDHFPYVYNGGGVAIGDINNDSLPDIYFSGNEAGNRLYLNEGQFKFKDITKEAGVGASGGWNNGVTMVDINHDGYLDIYLCRGGWQDTDAQRTNLLFINHGDLTFTEEAAAYGLDEKGYSNHAVFFDLDNDNDLDVYIINRPDSFHLPLSVMAERRSNPPDRNRDKLYVNYDGHYREEGLLRGITGNYGYSLAVIAADVDQDGYVDIYVSNDYATSDYLYMNQGDGTFRDEIGRAMNHLSLFSMGADIADMNNDGLEDIMVMEMRPDDYVRSKVSMPSMDTEGFHAIVNHGLHRQYMHNMLHLNEGNMFFGDVSQLAGVGQTDWSWACLASDFDNDGYRDMFVSNGFRRDLFDGDVRMRLDEFVKEHKNQYATPEAFFEKGFQDFVNVYKPVKIINYMFRNTGDLHFVDVSYGWGMQDSTFSNGAALGDLDRDGDLDLVVNNLDEEALVYENRPPAENGFLNVRLAGPEGNPDGIGAKIWLYAGEGLQYNEHKMVRGYLSSNEPVVHFGLGSLTTVDSLVVKWNDGMVNKIAPVKANRTLIVRYDAAAKPRNKTKKQDMPIFSDATSQSLAKPFIHKENEYNEFRDQVLLPHMFSRSGPFISVADVNGDGREDFFIGGARGQSGALYLKQPTGFKLKPVPAFDTDKEFEDMGSAFFDVDGDGDNDLYVVSGGSEGAEGSDRYQDRLYLNDGTGNFSRTPSPKTISSGSCVLPYDIDGDGDLDLFVGGQVVAHRYPRSPRSYVLFNDGGKLNDVTDQVAPIISRVGMVNTGVWTDLDGDGSAELVLAGEWMAMRVFRFTGGQVQDVTDTFGLQHTEGWWNKLVAEDIDDDGDMDLVAGNLGENYKFSASADKPFEVFASDFDGNGTNDIFLAKFNQDRLVPIRGRECTSQQMPVIASKFPSYRAFAEADLPGILGAGMEDALNLKAYVFSSVIFENVNGRLVPQKLPLEAQFSAVMGIIVRDFDGDGIKDILTAGNKFDVEVETTPADASPGLFMKGLGDGRFRSVRSTESGFFVPYNVKDVMLINAETGPAILVSSNNDSLRVFQCHGVLGTKSDRLSMR